MSVPNSTTIILFRWSGLRSRERISISPESCCSREQDIHGFGNPTNRRPGKKILCFFSPFFSSSIRAWKVSSPFALPLVTRNIPTESLSYPLRAKDAHRGESDGGDEKIQDVEPRPPSLFTRSVTAVSVTSFLLVSWAARTYGNDFRREGKDCPRLFPRAFAFGH